MVMVFTMPEKLEIGFKFFNGKLGIKDLLIRLIGVIPAGIIGGSLYGLTDNSTLALIVGGVIVITGWIIGSKKLFNDSTYFLQALLYERELKRKTTTLINKRRKA